ncbi:MAG: hypothetical protein JO200_18105 [Comamonas sp.]|nr:hypothetical protein [Comamonas sp.]
MNTFERMALYVHEHGFPVTTLGASRWRNMQQIKDRGVRAAARSPGRIFLLTAWPPA